MARESYQQQLQQLTESVRQMGEKVLEELDLGLQALREHDRTLAQSLDTWDDQVDEMNLHIERACTDLLALQQPVAVDLRLITSVFKIITDLERIGDLAVNIGEYGMDAEVFVLLPKEELLTLGAMAKEMVREAIDAFVTRDAERALALIHRDEQLDNRCWELRRRVIAKVIDIARQAHTLDEAKDIADDLIPVFWSIRDLERVGDHAVNIAGRTIYLATGKKDYL
ncbi:MAG: phosphate signaling complex protein PhoU [Candidatus Bipolaricaulota bacterium]|nr:phosphate signaling complex protein PhoU [Candidatus Bipolaricaulota bacterium]MDW8110167.1 phosphate signaling complex protein PhoU [Candidatus Bipolaricaulota bacterium]MDW8329199.1 phosphate signaling complex protein PhoU [Candidatus Bipolaricaulota bacterium]